jgi:hypothetical protein
MVNDNPLSVLWIGRATIYEYQPVTDPETFQTKQSLVALISDEPCRLSHKTESTVDINSGAPSIKQVTVLFIRPDLKIKEGSVIEVTQRGVTNKYKRASKPPIYSNHQEVTLELYEDFA